MSYFKYTHIYPNIKTLTELIQYKGWEKYVNGKGSPVNPNDILNYEDNRASIRSMYTPEKNKQIQSGSEGSFIELGTVLKIDDEYQDDILKVFDSNTIIVPKDDAEVFISESLKKIVNSVNTKIKFNDGKDTLKLSNVKPKVWLWCRSLGISGVNKSDGKPDYFSEGEIFDLSPFVISCNTSVTKTGGNFSISLPPITCDISENGLSIKKRLLNLYTRDGVDNMQSKDSVNRFIQTNRGDVKTENVRNNFLFHLLGQENDIIFISFDNTDLDIEGKVIQGDEEVGYSPIIDKSRIAGRVYDMIGLIDTNEISYSSNGTQVSISINGRDFIKPLIEDNAYSLGIKDGVGNVEGLVKNDNSRNWGRPLLLMQSDSNSPLRAFYADRARTVDDYITYLFSHLASVEIAPDSLFESYKTQEGGFGLSKYTHYESESTYETVVGKKTGKEKRIEKTVRLKGVEYTGAGIWQIIKVLVDDRNVRDRVLLDASISTNGGSLMNIMQQFIDGRFIEFVSDTYCDQFFFILRRPPYNYTAVKDYLAKLVDTNQTCLEIHDEDVVNERLRWYDGEVYSYYKIAPVLSTPMTQQYFYPDNFGVCYFREYCEIYGNRGLYLTSNYMPINRYSRDGVNQSQFLTQKYEDLAYVIETTAYLPFTRMGSITVKYDRRLKRGVWIRYRPTGEIYYINSVSQSWTAANGDRMTTLSVERGMVEYNVNGDYILPLYFNIISGLPNTPAKNKMEKLETVESEPRELLVYFDFDRDVLIDEFNYTLTRADVSKDSKIRKNYKEVSENSIKELLSELIEDPKLKIKIIGHTDSVGSQDYNYQLGLRRSEHIKNELIKRWNDNALNLGQFDETRIITESRGETQPRKKSGETNVKNAGNRRIEVVYITQKGDGNRPAPQRNSNDLSKCRVNQEILNFFVKRLQMADKIENFDTIGNYTEPQYPESLKK